MCKIIDDNFNFVMFFPPILITIINCLIQDNWSYVVVFFPSIIAWMLLFFLAMKICVSLKPQFDKKTENAIITNLNIKKKWKNFTDDQQYHFYSHYYYELEKMKNNKVQTIVDNELKKIFAKFGTTFYNDKKPLFQKSARIQIEDEFKKLSFEDIIKLIDDLVKTRNENALKEKIKTEKIAIKEKELQKIRLAEQQIIEQNIFIIKQEEERKQKEEDARNEALQKIEIERLKQIKKEELIEENKIRRDNEYKERIKRELLEKQRKLQLESEAIQELINIGELSDNFSFQNNRVPIPSYIKEAVWKRDKQSCVTCGSKENIEFDHNIPVSKGGSNSINNIQVLCQKCNRTKSNKII